MRLMREPVTSKRSSFCGSVELTELVDELDVAGAVCAAKVARPSDATRPKRAAAFAADSSGLFIVCVGCVEVTAARSTLTAVVVTGYDTGVNCPLAMLNSPKAPRRNYLPPVNSPRNSPQCRPLMVYKKRGGPFGPPRVAVQD